MMFPKPQKRPKKPFKFLKRSYIKKRAYKKKTPRKKLVQRLDELVSEIVRKRTPYCVICRKKEQLGAGHLFSRRYYATRWDIENNVFTQCWGCNFRHVKDPMPYYTWFQDKYGYEKFRQVYEMTKPVKKFSNKDLEELYERLQNST